MSASHKGKPLSAAHIEAQTAGKRGRRRGPYRVTPKRAAQVLSALGVTLATGP